MYALADLEQIVVHQKVELLEVLTGYETINRYILKNQEGEQLYYAEEESGACMRMCCGNNRSFIIHISDNSGNEVMRVSREFKCFAGCCWCADVDCCAFEVCVEAPVGTPVGYVRQAKSFWKPHYQILDVFKDHILTTWGPCCGFQAICCRGDIDFKVYERSNKSATIGKISKQWAGVVRDFFTDADNFGVFFPRDMDINMKATLIGATFLIDFMYFESTNKNK
ncbi:phospholipid scramblase 1-like [Saccoglossus kowalevskii]